MLISDKDRAGFREWACHPENKHGVSAASAAVYASHLVRPVTAKTRAAFRLYDLYLRAGKSPAQYLGDVFAPGGGDCDGIPAPVQDNYVYCDDCDGVMSCP